MPDLKADPPITSLAVRSRIVVLGGGIAGLTATRELERLFRGRRDVELVLVSRDNFLHLTPLLFEACSGVLELRHCAQPIRPCLDWARFVEAAVESVDLERRIVRAVAVGDRVYELPYDQLVVALGATTNLGLIPGSGNALTFKTPADALLLRNHVIECLERADVEADHRRRRQLLSFVVIGGGLVGVELLGELTAFADDVLRYYPQIRRAELRFDLFEVGDRLLPESTARLGAYADRVLRGRGATLHLSTAVSAIEPGLVRSKDGDIGAETIILAAGVVPSVVAASIEVEHDRRGRISTDAAMRSVSHPEVWAIGDCAEIPDPDGHPYPALAQHALREARAVARNIHAVDAGRPTHAFVHRSLGTMAAFGHMRAAAEVRGICFTGFFAWWLRRTYYLFQMPRWDRRLRIALDWTVALFFRPDLTKVDLALEREQEQRNGPAGARFHTERADARLRAG
jgi:NADH:ubiquinone reductase (H+-translocating)